VAALGRALSAVLVKANAAQVGRCVRNHALKSIRFLSGRHLLDFSVESQTLLRQHGIKGRGEIW